MRSHAILAGALTLVVLCAGACTERKRAVEHNNKGVHYARDGFYDAAVGEFKRALALDGDYSECRVNLGLVYVKMERWDEALDQFQQAAQDDPENAEAQFNTGFVYLEQYLKKKEKLLLEAMGPIPVTDLTEEAEKGAEEEMKPAVPPTEKTVEMSAADRANLAKAEEHLKRAVELSPSHAKANYHLGVAAAERGDKSGAIRAFERTIELDRELIDAYIRLGQLLHDQGSYDRAIGVYLDAARVRDNNEYLHNNLGMAYVEQGKLDRGVESFKKSVRINAGYSTAQFNLGMTLAKMGKNREAMAHLELYLQTAKQKEDPERFEQAQQTISILMKKEYG